MLLIKNAAKINKPNYNRLPADEYVQLMTEFKSVIDEFGAENLNIGKYFDMIFMVLFTELLKTANKMSKSSFTALINNADSFRDDAIYALLNVLKAYLRNRDEKIRTSAQRIIDKINSYGSLATKQLSAQTSTTTDLTDDLENYFAKDIELLGLGNWVGDVKKTNNEFEDLIAKRDKESREKTDTTIREVRKELDGAFRNLCSSVEMSAAVEDNDIYNKFIKAVNVIFKRYTVNSGRTGKENSDE